MIDKPAIHFQGIQGTAPRLLVGFDLVDIAALVDSVTQFGAAFKQRLFTAAELAYAEDGVGLWPERLAARFAAKEATIKALDLANAGIAWRDIEVVKLATGGCELRLHGPVCSIARSRGVQQWALSLSHDGGYAGAFVVGLVAEQGAEQGAELGPAQA